MGPAEPAIPFRYREVTQAILGCAIEVHRSLGPGLLETAYSACLAHEFERSNIAFEREVAIDIEYKGLWIANAFRADFVVAKTVVLEIKSVEALDHRHAAQVLTYLRLMKLEVGLLLNFNESTLKKGIRRLIRDAGPSIPTAMTHSS
jgi:GxxExxY protein